MERVKEAVPVCGRGGALKGLWCVLLLLGFLALPPVPAAGKQPAADPPAAADIAAAIARGSAWLERHPATVGDGGLPDMLDEGVGYYVRRNLSRDETERTRLAERLQTHMERLADLPEFEQWVYGGRKTLTDHYHLVLAMHLLQVAGEPDDRQAEIVAQTVRVLRLVPHCDPSKRLTIALFLQQLDADPGISMPLLQANSRVERIAQGRPPRLPPPGATEPQRIAAALELFALVHEIVALTDFGRLPPPSWLAQRRTAVIRFLDEAVGWTAAGGNFDLTAELLISARMLHEPLTGNFRDAVLAIITAQQDDGSWGSHTTRRENRQRHAVLTATTALWVYLHAPPVMQIEEQVLY